MITLVIVFSIIVMEIAFLNPGTDLATLRGLLEAWRPNATEILRLLKEPLGTVPRLVLVHRFLHLVKSKDSQLIGILVHCLEEASSLDGDNLGLEISSLVSRILESNERGPDVYQAIESVARFVPLLSEGGLAIISDCMQNKHPLPEGLMATLLCDTPLTPRELSSSPQDGLILLGDYTGLRLRRFGLARKLFGLAGKEGLSRALLCRMIMDGKVPYHGGEHVFKRSVSEMADACDDVNKLEEVLLRRRAALAAEGLSEWADNLAFACRLRSIKSLGLVYSTMPLDTVLTRTGLSSAGELQDVIDWSRSSDLAISLTVDGHLARF